MNWTETILGGTRSQLLVLLRRSRRSISELAVALGISDNAVRTHIAALQRDGMVMPTGVERATGGKPAQLYEITPEAEEMFPKAYAYVLGALVQLLEERSGREEVIALLREVGARAAAAQRIRGGGPDTRVQAAAEVLRQMGGDVEVVRAEGGWSIRGHGCPLSAVVGEHPEVCALAEQLVAEIAGLPAQECCDRSGRPRCVFRIPSESPVTGSDRTRHP